MYLFTRTWRIDPEHFTDAMEWTAEITTSVRDLTGREIDAWTAVMSPEAGTIAWSMWAERLAELEAAGDTIAADADHRKMVEKGAEYFEGSIEDRLAALVHGTLDPEARPNYVTVATAVIANGRMSAGVASGIEIADFVTRVTGQRTLFTVGVTGPYGSVAWITGNPDIGSLEAGEAALMADAAWSELINRVGTDYAPGASQAIYRRVA
jgi:hypothetical protein